LSLEGRPRNLRGAPIAPTEIATRTHSHTASAETRHTHATALLLGGIPDWVVSRRLGHAHVQTTLDLYGWVTDDEALRAAANWKRFTEGWKVTTDAR
jgi:integrase